MISKVSSDSFWNEIEYVLGTCGGVYLLFCIDENEAIIPTSRVLGEDLDGILYIGNAKSFLDRVIDLKKGLSPIHASGVHECGKCYKAHRFIKEYFPYEGLCVEFRPTEKPRKAGKKALNEYVEKFGELPPLNRIG